MALRIGGFLRLARWRLRRLSFSRRQVASGVVVVVLLIGGIAYWKSDPEFRANEVEETEESSFDYIEHVSMEKFRAKLDSIPETQADLETRSGIITQLAINSYFRLPTVADRQAFLGTWNVPAEWKTIVQTVESGANGAWDWLTWVEPYCEESDKAGWLSPKKAYAQNAFLCQPALSEARRNFLQRKYNPYQQPALVVNSTVLAEYLQVWRGFFSQAIVGRCRTEPGWPDNPRERTYYKQCWSAEHLDALYTVFWPDIGARRPKIAFSASELNRLQKVHQLNDQVIGEAQDEAFRKVLELQGEILMYALPIEKAIGIPLKIGGKVVEGLAANRVTAPWAYGVAIQVARNGNKIANFTSHYGRQITINVSNVFSASKIFGSSALKFGTLRTAEWQSMILTRANDAANLIVAKSPLAEASKRALEEKLSQQILGNIYTISAKKTKGLARRTKDFTALGLAGRDGKSYLNEEWFLLMVKNRQYNVDKAARKIQGVWVHEFNHQLSGSGVKNIIGGVGYSKKLQYSPIEEGMTEYLTHQRMKNVIGYTTDEVAYPSEVEMISDFRYALKRMYQRDHSMDEIRAALEADKKLEQLYYFAGDSGSRVGELEFEALIRRGLPSNSHYHNEFNQLGDHGVIKWITKTWEENGNLVYDMLESLFE